MRSGAKKNRRGSQYWCRLSSALEPFESPFSWFTGIVTVDGERLTNVGIRKKGFIGSMNENKPSLKIRFDKFEEDQTYLDAKRLTLNNDVQDPSYVRQCLAYDLFRAVGPCPRCNYAHVFVNGVDMGVYTNVESIKSHSSAVTSAIQGQFIEGTLSDFREGWMGTFNQRPTVTHQIKRPSTDWRKFFRDLMTLS